MKLNSKDFKKNYIQFVTEKLVQRSVQSLFFFSTNLEMFKHFAALGVNLLQNKKYMLECEFKPTISWKLNGS